MLNQQHFKVGEIESETQEAILKVTANIARVEGVEAEFRRLYATCEASFTKNTGEATDRILEIQRQIQSLVDRTFQGGDADSSGARGGHQPRDRQIFDPRDYKIESLSGSPSLAAFKTRERKSVLNARPIKSLHNWKP